MTETHNTHGDAQHDDAHIDETSEARYDANTDGTPDHSESDVTVEPDADDTDAVAKLKKELAACRSERHEYLTGWQRARADLANYKSEQETEQKRRADAAVAAFAQHILPVLDSFEGAFGNTDVWERVDATWRHGVENIYTQLQSALKEYDITPIEAHGAVFDPTYHEPVATEETDDPEQDERIIDVLQTGYCMGDKVLRPTKVRIAQYTRSEASDAQ